MYNQPRIQVVQHAGKKGIPRPLGIVLPAAQHATTVKNQGIGQLFAALHQNQVAALHRAPIGLFNQNLKEPSGPFLWAPVFQVLVM